MDFFFIALAYFIGSIPFGLVLSKLFLGIDLRKMGSGNIGATNVFRTGNKTITLLTVLCDAGKGAIMVAIASHYTTGATPLLVAFATVLGHVYPVFLKFKGGKGFATTLGLTAVLSGPIFFISAGLWVWMVVTFSYSSLGAISSLLLMPIAFFTQSTETGYLFLTLSGLGFWKHRENIKRLFQKTESKTDLSKFIK